MQPYPYNTPNACQGWLAHGRPGSDAVPMMRLRQAGDGAMLAEFSDRLDPAAIAQVRALDVALNAAPPEGLIETMPSLRSLLVLHDPLRLSARRLTALLEGLLQHLGDVTIHAAEWLIPVCYDTEFALDLAEVASTKGMTEAEVIRRHSTATYTAIAVGSFPGLPYLGGLDPALVLPRRVPPRLLVPAGTVAIALEMSNIYPQSTPGGWNILGRTPVPLFNPSWPAPSLLSPGDIVRHRPMPRAEYDALLAGFADGSLAPQQACAA